MRTYRLRVLIPLLLLAFNLVCVAFISWQRINDYRGVVLKHEKEVLESIMIPLQNNLSGRLLEGNATMARESFSFAMLSASIEAIFLADENNVIVMSDDAALEGSPATAFSEFDASIAKEAAENKEKNVFIEKNGNCIYGYFSVILGAAPGELRSHRVGTLFVSFNVSDLLEKSKKEAMTDAALMSVFLIIATIILGLSLDYMVTRRVTALSKAIDKAASGDLQARAGISGVDEIAALSRSFDNMAEQLAATLEMLKESEGKFRAIAEQMADMIIMFDDNGVITYASPVANKIFEISASEMEGKVIFDLLCDDDSPEALATLSSALSGSSEIWSIELRFKKPNGSIFNGEVTGSRFEHRGMVGTVGLIRDITAKRQAEEQQKNFEKQMAQAQKMELVGQMAGGVAHDFNNLLGIILGNAQVAEMETDGNSEARESIQTIIDASMRAKALTSKMLAFSRKDRVNFETQSPVSIIKSLIDMLSRSISKSISIITDFRADRNVRCDANQIIQALLNICSNAADAMPNGGSITISTDIATFDLETCDSCGGSLSGDYFEISVSDTGSGMSKEVLERILEPFYTTKEVGKGTGLGLFVTHGIILDHNGHLRINSEPGHGTTMKVLLPLADEREHAPAAGKEKRTGPSGAETILVVDDELALLNVTGKQLMKAGYNVLLEQDGRQAIKTFKERRDSISLAVLDVMMPGVDGVEVFRELRKTDPSIKTLFATGHSAHANLSSLLGYDVRMIKKPFQMKDLLDAVRATIDGAPLPPDNEQSLR